ncbi:MAG: hypothetical protein KF797_08635, partial [Flavobacteriales bacterium]|nr:hypothetical protein [Flavobacteriales bacterium]
NAWAMHQLPVPGSGASSIALGMYFYRSLVTHNTKFRMESGPLGDILFNGHSTTDTIRVAEDTVLRYVDMGATSFYQLHITTTYGCGVVGDLHAVEGRSYPYFYQAGIRPDSLAYVVAAPVYCYYSGHTYDAPAWDWINDSTQLRDTWAYLSDCYPQMDVGELVHVALAKDVNGVMKYGWVSLRRVDGQRLWVGAVAIEP